MMAGYQAARYAGRL